MWWLENSSYPIEIIDKEKVKVLVRSDELKRRYRHDPIIVSFEWGKGVVYHMISHFYLQRSETRTKKQGITVEPPIVDTLERGQPLNKGQVVILTSYSDMLTLRRG